MKRGRGEEEEKEKWRRRKKRSARSSSAEGMEGREEEIGVKERKRETCERMPTRKQRKERRLK